MLQRKNKQFENIQCKKTKESQHLYTHSTLLNHCLYSKRGIVLQKYNDSSTFILTLTGPEFGPHVEVLLKHSQYIQHLDESLGGEETLDCDWSNNFIFAFLWGQFFKYQTNNKHYSEIRHISKIISILLNKCTNEWLLQNSVSARMLKRGINANIDADSFLQFNLMCRLCSV